MLLSKPDLIARVKAGLKEPSHYRSLSFFPVIQPNQITDQCSIDLKLAPIFTVFKKKSYVATYRIEDPQALFQAEDLWDHHSKEVWKLEPRQFVLSRTLEVVHLPNDLMALVEGRSSFARLGIGIHVTAPKIDPGWSDPITLELTNHSEVAWELKAGLPICQLMLIKLSKPLRPEDLYGVSAKDQFAGHDMPIPTRKKKAEHHPPVDPSTLTGWQAEPVL